MANKLTLSAVGLLSLLAAGTFAQTATTDPVGFVASQLPKNSDTRFSPSLERPAAFSGSVSSVSGAIISMAGAPGWASNQYQHQANIQPNTYYVRFASGVKLGSVFTVTANGAADLTVDLNGDTLSGVVAGDSVVIVPYWTLGTAFPATDAGISFEASASVFNRGTEIRFPNIAYVGINPPAPNIYYFLSGAWRMSGANSGVSYDDTPIPHDGYVIVRNKGVAGRVVVVGSVVTKRLAMYLNSEASASQDNVIALLRPVPVTLNDSGLIASGAFVASPSVFAIKDTLIVFDDTVEKINKSASAIYYYRAGAWRKSGEDANGDFGNDVVFQPGSGVVLRKAANGVGSQTQTWLNDPKY